MSIMRGEYHATDDISDSVSAVSRGVPPVVRNIGILCKAYQSKIAELGCIFLRVELHLHQVYDVLQQHIFLPLLLRSLSIRRQDSFMI